MNTYDLFMIILSNLAAIVSIGIFFYRFLYKKPYEKGLRQGRLEGRTSGLRDGILEGLNVSRSFGRRTDDSRNKEKLIKQPRIRDFIENKTNKVDNLQTNISEFQAENNQYMVSLYSGLSENADKHIAEIGVKLNISENKGKKLLILLVLIGVNTRIVDKRLTTFKAIQTHFKDNPNIEFETFIEIDDTIQKRDLDEIIQNFIQEDIKKHDFTAKKDKDTDSQLFKSE